MLTRRGLLLVSLLACGIPLAQPAFSLTTAKQVLVTPYISESRTLLRAMTPQPPPQRKYIVDATIRAMIGASLWNKPDLLYVHAAHSQQASILNWKNPSVFPLDQIIGAPIFTIDRGWSGDASNDVETTLAINSAFSQFTQNDASVGAYSLTSAASSELTGRLAGMYATLEDVHVSSRLSIDFASFLINSLTGDTVASTDGKGLFIGVRTASNAVALFKNGVSILTGTTASKALVADEFWFAGLSGGQTVALSFMGSSFSVAQSLVMTTIWQQKYLIPLGATP